MIHIIIYIVFLGAIFNLLMQINELRKVKESADKDHTLYYLHEGKYYDYEEERE